MINFLRRSGRIMRQRGFAQIETTFDAVEPDTRVRLQRLQSVPEGCFHFAVPRSVRFLIPVGVHKIKKREKPWVVLPSVTRAVHRAFPIS